MCWKEWEIECWVRKEEEKKVDGLEEGEKNSILEASGKCEEKRPFLLPLSLLFGGGGELGDAERNTKEEMEEEMEAVEEEEIYLEMKKDLTHHCSRQAI